MSVEELPAVVRITSRLHQLLQQARTLKDTTTIEPPLPLTDLVAETSHISETPADSSSENGEAAQTSSKQHAALETAARNIFYESVATCAIDEPDFVNVWNLLDVVQLCADYGQCDPSLALWLVEELLDSQTIDGCRTVFDYLESRRERLITNGFNRNKQMIVLRSCNELLRRLSRAEDAVFCGRVFIFLFQSFPLGDKSAVNLRGEFHVENTTIFDIPEPKSKLQGNGDVEMTDPVVAEAAEKEENDTDPSREETQVATEEEQKKDHAAADPASEAPKPTEDSTKAVSFDSNTKAEEEELVDDDAFYVTFWSLQYIFSNPTKLFVKDDFDAFKKGLDLTFKKFRSKSVVKPKDDQMTRDKDLKRKRNHNDAEFASTFNPKYLTSRDLFDLEMSDLTFQRHILVQCLIIIDFLLSLTPKAKKKMAELKAQKAMIYNYTLSDEDTTWATNTRGTIARYLQEDQDGKFYYRMVDNVLSRDKNWVRWKVESCPPIARPPLSTEEYVEAKAGAKRACANKRLKAVPTGAVDMSFVSDTENVDWYDTLKDPERFSTPSAETMLKEIQGIDLDLEMATEDEARELNEQRSSKTWQLLRMIAKDRFNLLEKIDERESKTLDVLVDATQEEVNGAGDGTEASLEAKDKPAADKGEVNDGETAGKDATTTLATEDIKTSEGVDVAKEDTEMKEVAVASVEAEEVAKEETAVT